MTDKAVIDDFMSQRRIAIAGVSRDPRKFGNALFKEFKKRGYEVFILHPEIAELEGSRCFSSLSAMPVPVDALLIATSAAHSAQLVRDAVANKVNRVWLHGGGQGAVSDEALRLCREHGLSVVAGQCPLMFLQPLGFHGLHAWWRRITGRYPK